MSHASAISQEKAACHTCYKVSPIEMTHCPRCHSSLHPRKRSSIQRTLALLITASVLYIPANIYPIMITSYVGQSEPSTILGGIMTLIDMGAYPVATIIFLASVIVPLAKLLAFFYLCWAVSTIDAQGLCDASNLKRQTQLFRIAEFMGKWSMVDVFVVSILVALVQIQGLMTVEPGIAGVSFCAVVIITMIAAESFDSRLIWDQRQPPNTANPLPPADHGTGSEPRHNTDNAHDTPPRRTT
ncbi:paraquat-inducible protein A [Aestuariicella sp. G3-2]|uniref:paraquat-inducible protein A n=1 Tax=Pseudomaricurvus albidus TaxID=2842452 RepID=UPI001C0A9FDD|nr:paraquat-inducible protein A [Aestuariicella albida]MBU3070661.1 paraquat-inducible protein A [Aestuariicella albida]